MSAFEDYKSVKVGAYTYQIIWGPEADHEMQQSEKSFAFCGLADHTKLCIYVGDHRAEGKKRNTLLHEIVHAIHVTYGLDDDLHKARSEHYVEVMAMALQSLMVDNPDLIKELLTPEVKTEAK
jgi:Zn-dependent peptidase ImmA (M78 family)